MISTTINFYDNNAEEYSKWMENVNFRKIQDRFLVQLAPGASILDFGCGSGRDAKYFLKNGFRVTATDGSREMCRIASANTGLSVQQMMFEDLDADDQYDAIWACASIMHLPSGELADVLGKMSRAIHKDGLIYTSFKYGSFEGEQKGRYYTDMTVGHFRKLIANVPDLKIREAWTTEDARPDHANHLWLNLILAKQSITQGMP